MCAIRRLVIACAAVRWALVLAFFLAGCGGPPGAGDPCTDSVRVCGDNGIGLACMNHFFVQVCSSGCKPKGDDITCSGKAP
jgi:hypothetical protein